MPLLHCGEWHLTYPTNPNTLTMPGGRIPARRGPDLGRAHVLQTAALQNKPLQISKPVFTTQ
eukprot:319091-Lingulodinium_polyedra.AAC.1